MVKTFTSKEETPRRWLRPLGFGRKVRKILDRLRRIEGQVRGLRRLIENEAEWIEEYLSRLQPLTAALKRTGSAIISAHMEDV